MVNVYTRILENLLVKINSMNKISDHEAIDIIFENVMNQRKLNILNIISSQTETK